MKGQVFSLEATIAISLLIIFAIVLSFIGTTSFTQHQTYERFHYISQDSLEVLTKTKVSYVVDKFQAIKDLKNQGVLKDEDMDKSLLDVIGSLWANESIKEATSIAESIFNLTIPENLGYEVSMDGNSIAKRDKPLTSLLSVSRTTVSGYAIGKPVEGYTAKAYLEKILGKNTASYFYFGGFVGQGNLTATIRNIPSDANISSIYIEGSFGSNFTLYINKSFCGIFNKTSSDYFAVDSFMIENQNCLSQINKGYEKETTFDLNFTSSDINKQFIGGGYIKVTYDTAEFAPPYSKVYRYYFPGIYGLINLYDSFYLPGDLNETEGMRIHLHYYSNLTTSDGAGVYMFLNVGGVEVNRTNATGEIVVDLSFENISEKFGGIKNLKGNVSKKTVPIRFGSEESVYISRGLADVILITDLSGSMGLCISNTSGNCLHNVLCNDPLINTSNVDRISKAKCLDKEFVSIILSNPGNRVGLVGFDGGGDCIRNYFPFSNDTIALYAQIDSYTASGGTCIACAINMGYDILNSGSDPTRKKFVVVMTDGLANTEPRTQNQSSPCNTGSSCDKLCGDIVCDSSIDSSIYASCRVNKELNATVYSIGFGPVVNCPIGNYTLIEIARCGNGTYYGSDNVTELENIYRTIAEQILEMAYITQKINITGEAFKGNYLYPDSYIEFYYEPEVKEEYGEISLKIETSPFGCNGTFFVPQQVKVLDITRTSYSSDFWSRRVYVNNSAYKWQNVWSLDSFGNKYPYLGDPFSIYFSPSYIKPGESNTVGLVLGLSPTNISGVCSSMDRVIYTGSLKSFTPYSPVFSYVEGRNITVFYDRDHDGSAEGSYVITIGKNLPKFNSTLGRVQDLNITHNAVDYAFLMLLNQLNFIGIQLPKDPLSLDRNNWPGTQNNPIDIMITPEILFDTLFLAAVPSLWGPANLEIKVWA
ncbi:MAG: vWA domain-containing protein [Candidatus Aenigmatarchaeota archaeon]